jgi:hypothetical protein
MVAIARCIKLYFTQPKRRFGRDEQKMKCAFSKHFSRARVLNLGHEPTMEKCVDNPHCIFCSSRPGIIRSFIIHFKLCAERCGSNMQPGVRFASTGNLDSRLSCTRRCSASIAPHWRFQPSVVVRLCKWHRRIVQSVHDVDLEVRVCAIARRRWYADARTEDVY